MRLFLSLLTLTFCASLIVTCLKNNCNSLNAVALGGQCTSGVQCEGSPYCTNSICGGAGSYCDDSIQGYQCAPNRESHYRPIRRSIDADSARTRQSTVWTTHVRPFLRYSSGKPAPTAGNVPARYNARTAVSAGALGPIAQTAHLKDLRPCALMEVRAPGNDNRGDQFG